MDIKMCRGTAYNRGLLIKKTIVEQKLMKFCGYCIGVQNGLLSYQNSQTLNRKYEY